MTKITCRFLKIHTALQMMCERNWKYQYRVKKRPLPEVCTAIGNKFVTSKILYETENLKGLSSERGWTKSAENLGASPFYRDLSIDTTYSRTNLALTDPINIWICCCILQLSPILTTLVAGIQGALFLFLITPGSSETFLRYLGTRYSVVELELKLLAGAGAEAIIKFRFWLQVSHRNPIP